MRGLTNQMVRDYQETLGYFHEWQEIREKQFLDYTVENILPREDERKRLNTIVLELLEFYTYTDIKERRSRFSLDIFQSYFLRKHIFSDPFMKKEKVDMLMFILEILVSMRKFTDSFPFCVDQGLKLDPKNHYFLFCNGFVNYIFYESYFI